MLKIKNQRTKSRNVCRHGVDEVSTECSGRLDIVGRPLDLVAFQHTIRMSRRLPVYYKRARFPLTGVDNTRFTWY